MLTLMYTTVFNLIAGGSLTDKNSALFKPHPPKYTHTQIVWGLVFDIVVVLTLLSWLFYVAYRTYGGPGAWFHRQRTETTSAG